MGLNCRSGRLAPVAAIGNRTLQGREPRRRRLEQDGDDVSILIIGRQYGECVHQAERIDADVALLALDFLARIVPARIDVWPPFSALFTLWLSTIESVGVGALPASSRTRP